MNKICPACGYNFNKKYQGKEDIGILIEDRKHNTVDMLRSVVSLIQSSIEADRDS